MAFFTWRRCLWATVLCAISTIIVLYIIAESYHRSYYEPLTRDDINVESIREVERLLTLYPHVYMNGSGGWCITPNDNYNTAWGILIYEASWWVVFGGVIFGWIVSIVILLLGVWIGGAWRGYVDKKRSKSSESDPGSLSSELDSIEKGVTEVLPVSENNSSVHILQVEAEDSLPVVQQLSWNDRVGLFLKKILPTVFYSQIAKEQKMNKVIEAKTVLAPPHVLHRPLVMI